MNYYHIKNKLNRLLRIGIIKSTIINFKCLPFRQAIHFPIIVTRNTKFYNLSGNIQIDSPVKFALVRIGYNGEDTLVWKNERALVKLEGLWIVKGDIHLGVGTVVRVEKNAVLTTFEGIRINFRNKIICYKAISLGRYFNSSWEVQIIDSDMHFLKDSLTNDLLVRDIPIVISDYVWIGNRTTILKGTFLPQNCTIASNSVCNKNYSVPENSVLGGVPAKLLKTNIYRPFTEEILLEKIN